MGTAALEREKDSDRKASVCVNARQARGHPETRVGAGGGLPMGLTPQPNRGPGTLTRTGDALLYDLTADQTGAGKIWIHEIITEKSNNY